MPDYLTEVGRLIESKLEYFIYSDISSDSIGDVIEKGPCDLGDGEVYHG